jgi:hypothetical protein
VFPLLSRSILIPATREAVVKQFAKKMSSHTDAQSEEIEKIAEQIESGPPLFLISFSV